MPITKHNKSNAGYAWSWTEAFDKFGFGDGDGQIEMGTVEDVLVKAGYAVVTNQWGLHNTTIDSIKHDGSEQMPLDNPKITIGYDDPRDYLPPAIIEILDAELPDPPNGGAE